jgi:hypothetical protein
MVHVRAENEGRAREVVAPTAVGSARIEEIRRVNRAPLNKGVTIVAVDIGRRGEDAVRLISVERGAISDPLIRTYQSGAGTSQDASKATIR